MKVFLSYPSERRPQADALRLALEAEGHQVFFDRADLPAGEAYHHRIREAIDAADLFIFLVCPESVDPGYALTELALAQARWPRPSGHVLPVVLAPVPLAQLPAWLQSVTMLQPQGDMVAETVAAVARLALRGGGRRLRRVGVAAAVLALGAATAWLVPQRQARQQAEAQAAAARDTLAREVAAAAELCRSSSPALAWGQFEALVVRHPADPGLRTAQQDCGMHWLRHMRPAGERQTFAEQVDRVQPVLASALPAATGARAGDLHAHLGWGEFLRWRDGTGAGDPLPHYQRAVQVDPDNPYGHAMWAWRIGWFQGPDDAMRQHFEAALRTPRARTDVRRLQLGLPSYRGTLTPYAVQAADAMRRGGEAPPDDRRQPLWRQWCEQGLLSPDYRPAMLAALAPPDALATYRWWWPIGQVGDDGRPAWRLCEAVLQAQAGDRAAARAGLQALLHDLGAEAAQGRVGREAAALVRTLGG